MRFRNLFPAGSRIIERALPMPGGNVSYNPHYVAPDSGPGPQQINNPFVQGGAPPSPTPAIQQVVTQKITGGGGHTTDEHGQIRDADGLKITTGAPQQIGTGITATPAVLPPGWQPAQEVSRFSMPFPGVTLNPRQKAQLNAQAIAEQMNLQAQLLAGEQRRDPGAFSQAYGGAINQASQSLLPSEAESRITEQDLMEEASQRKRLEDFGKLPSTTSQGLQDAYRQHYQQYPWAKPGAERPKTRAEKMREIQAKEEMASQQQLAEFSTQLGLPPIPMRRNKDGQLEPMVSIESLLATTGVQQRAAASSAERQKRELFDAKMTALRAGAPKRPDAYDSVPDKSGAVSQAVTDWNAYQSKVQSLVDEFYGDQSQPPVPKPPSQFPAEVPAQLQSVEFNDGLAAERAFELGQLKAGQPFTVNGVTVSFDRNGVPRPVQ